MRLVKGGWGAATSPGSRRWTGHRPNHRFVDCLGVVCSDEMYMRVVLDRVTDMLFERRIPDTIDGRFLAGGIARLVNTVAPG